MWQVATGNPPSLVKACLPPSHLGIKCRGVRCMGRLSCFRRLQFLQTNIATQDKFPDKCALKGISFVLSVPPSNAYTERVFSLMNHAWSENRNRLTVSMVKSELQVRLNFNLSCIEFKSFIEQNQSLILAAKSNSKYRWKA